MVYSKIDKPQRLQSEKLVLEELPDELMVYDPARNKAFCLNQSAAFVWKHSDGKTTVEEMAEFLGQELKRPGDEQVIWLALDVLSKDGLLAPSTVLPEIQVGVTRRALLQKFGVGAAVTMPLVTVLFVSPPKAHASTIGKSDWKDDGNDGHGDWNKNWKGSWDGNGKGHGGFWGFLGSWF